MSDLSNAFHETFRPLIVHITVSCPRLGPPWAGTGCIMGVMANPKHEPRAVIATAGHVVRSAEDEEVEWTVRRVNKAGRLTRSITFTTPAEHPGPEVHRYIADDRLDLGCIIAAATADDGKSFLNPGPLHGVEKGPPLINPNVALGEGTRVAWAGFPGGLAQHLGFPQLAYYEGVIAATVYSDGHPPLYVLDGHNARGVSGGPVWAWDDERKGPELVGVISSYLYGDRVSQDQDTHRELPGFTFAIPINPLHAFLAARYRKGDDSRAMTAEGAAAD